MDKDRHKIIITEINKLDDSAKIIIKASIGVLQSKLIEIVNDLEELKKEINLEEKNNDRKKRKEAKV